MDSIYVLVSDGIEWEDILIVLDKEEAIQLSQTYKQSRVEIFKKNTCGYTPTYTYYRNGIYYQT